MCSNKITACSALIKKLLVNFHIFQEALVTELNFHKRSLRNVQETAVLNLL